MVAQSRNATMFVTLVVFFWCCCCCWLCVRFCVAHTLNINQWIQISSLLLWPLLAQTITIEQKHFCGTYDFLSFLFIYFFKSVWTDSKPFQTCICVRREIYIIEFYQIPMTAWTKHSITAYVMIYEHSCTPHKQKQNMLKYLAVYIGFCRGYQNIYCLYSHSLWNNII